jgi:hypothetical protein
MIVNTITALVDITPAMGATLVVPLCRGVIGGSLDASHQMMRLSPVIFPRVLRFFLEVIRCTLEGLILPINVGGLFRRDYAAAGCGRRRIVTPISLLKLFEGSPAGYRSYLITHFMMDRSWAAAILDIMIWAIR